ncbi:MarR family winged helix-turn-helix transcriptional regulator [Tepidamorphus sp. 3E244]|uniref:MarR family winged helix-turn-helix transcriptional regulator n=1 Tax=Tepidamorphus sp. 3E244 TaxID=3385498 RepID=UPI0038FD1ED9
MSDVETGKAKTRPKKPKTASASARRLPLTVSRPQLLDGDSDQRFRELVHELFALFARHDEIRAGHGHYIGLRGIEYTVLISIAHLGHYGDVNVKTVADHLHLSGAFITTVTNRLNGAGLVRKTSDKADARRVTLEITDDGHALLEKLAPVQTQVNDVEFGSLDRDEFETLLGLVRKLVDSSGQAVALQKYLSRSGN